MAKLQTNRPELKGYLLRGIDIDFEQGRLTANARRQIVLALELHLPSLVTQLNLHGKATLPVSGSAPLTIQLLEGKDPKSGNFNFFGITPKKKTKLRELRCFLGHRFIQRINNTLRFNLRQCLEPMNVRLDWSGQDMNAVGFFDDILQRIEKSHFCIFDNRETKDKPNVYIEAGMAIVLKRPFIFAAHASSLVQIPSDLNHINCLKYQDYKDLSTQLYFRLPTFLKSTGLWK